MLLTIILLSISCSLDGLFVGLSYGLKKIKIPLLSGGVICSFSIVSAFIGGFSGHLVSGILTPVLGNWLGGGLLILLAIWMIHQQQKEEPAPKPIELENQAPQKLMTIVVKSFGISIHILKEPASVDMDRSGLIDLKEAVLLGLALSFDAFAVALSASIGGFPTWLLPITIGISQMIFMKLGGLLSNALVCFTNRYKKLLSYLPSLILLILGLSKLIG